MKRISIFIISVLIILLIFSSCEISQVDEGTNINKYLLPYLEFTLSDDGNYYTASVIEGASVKDVYIPSIVNINGNLKTVKYFDGFKNPEDAKNIKTIIIDSTETTVTQKVLVEAEKLSTLQYKNISTDAVWTLYDFPDTDEAEFLGWFTRDGKKVKNGDKMEAGQTEISSKWARHAFENISAKDPTCTETGWNAYQKCACGYTIGYVEKTPLGHSLEEVNIKGGTETTYKCTRCGLLFSDSDAIGNVTSYTITYDLDEGKLPDGVSNPDKYIRCDNTDLNGDIVINNPVKQYFSFKGWRLKDSDDSTAVTDYTISKETRGDITLVAIWEENRKIFSITYDYAGGSLTQGITNPECYILYEDSNKNEDVIISNAPARNGYSFEGWKLRDSSETATTTYTIEAGTAGDIELVATWKEILTKPGDTITLGSVTWKALSVDTEGKKALLISENILETMVFDDNSNSYDGSAVQTYLGSVDFLTTYGLSTDYMKRVDVTTDIETTTLSFSGSDYVFLLSRAEAFTYYEDIAFRGSEYDDSSFSWWLRSPNSLDIDCVYSVIPPDIHCNCHYYDESGVRPAFWYIWGEDVSNTYTISYDLGKDVSSDAAGYPASYVRYKDSSKDQDITISDIPTKEGYIFNGWKLKGEEDSSAITPYIITAGTTGNITLEAVWGTLQKGDKISFLGEIITLGEKDGVGITWKAISIDEEYRRALLICENPLYKSRFSDWYFYSSSDIRKHFNDTSADGFISKYGLSTDYMRKVDVITKSEVTTVTHEGSDYVFLLSKTEAENTDYFANDKTRIAYNSSHDAETWYLRSVENDYALIYYVEEDGSIYKGSYYTARWVRPAFWYSWAYAEYSITYSIGDNASKAEGNPASYIRNEDPSQDKDVTIPNAPTKGGYTFMGWKLQGTDDATADLNYTITKETTGDITLVAVWKENVSEYDITYSIGDGAVDATGNPTKYTRYFGDTENHDVIISNAPSRSGYVFKGWKLSTDSVVTRYNYTIPSTTTGDITLVAVWGKLVPYGSAVSSVRDTLVNGKDSAGNDIFWEAISIDTDNKRALMISERVLEYMAFDSISDAYEKSAIRNYLNKTTADGFIGKHSISTSNIKKVDVTSEIEVTSISESGTDYFFLLSWNEASNAEYFANNAARVAYDISNTLSLWWLRSRASHGNEMSFIPQEGGLLWICRVYATTVGVRPAFWYYWN